MTYAVDLGLVWQAGRRQRSNRSVSPPADQKQPLGQPQAARMIAPTPRSLNLPDKYPISWLWVWGARRMSTILDEDGILTHVICIAF